MKGFTEICVSFSLGLACFLGLVRVNEKLERQRRMGPQEEPVYHRREIRDPRLTGGSPNPPAPVVVAVVDTGCDINHPYLKESIWTNLGEFGFAEDGTDKSTNGIDDDGNGFVDDVHGWDFVTDSPAVMDEHGHGTHISGIIAASGDRDVSLMILKYYDAQADGRENLANTIAAFNYAVRMRARIINYSGGGIIRSSLEETALTRAMARGVVVVAAAGNEGANSDFFHFYPADYDLPNIISVTAVDRLGRLLPSSNFGRSTVDVAAIGKNVYSTLPGGEFGYMTGTSQAAAAVTGAIARLMALHHDSKSPDGLIGDLLASGRESAYLRDKVGRGQWFHPDATPSVNVGALTDE